MVVSLAPVFSCCLGASMLGLSGTPTDVVCDKEWCVGLKCTSWW